MAAGHRERLPDERLGTTHRFVIHSVDENGQPYDYKGYLTIGLYPDGRVGEIFLKMDKVGSTLSGMLDSFAIAVSMLLQSGTPLEDIIKKFKGTRFAPEGRTDTKREDGGYVVATSPVDYVCRWLEGKFLPVEVK